MNNSLTPLVILSIGALGNLVAGSLIHRSIPSTQVTHVCDLNTLLTLSMAFVVDYYSHSFSDTFWDLTPSIIIVKISACLITFVILIVSISSRWHNSRSTYEYSTLLLFSLTGLFIILSANNLILIYLGIELYSYSVIILTNLDSRSGFSTEAGLKFFRVGSFASIIFLLGSAIVYLFTGTLELSFLSLWDLPFTVSILCISLLIKLAASPFHWWAPDVYEGAPIESTLFIVIIPKICLTALRIKVLSVSSWELTSYALIPVGVLSIIMGTLGALEQSGFKRFLSYSGIGHIGFIILGRGCSAYAGFSSAMFYLFLYILVSVLSWSILSSIFIMSHDSTGINIKGITFISQITGVAQSYPALSVAMRISMLSMAGIPPFAGFFAKINILLDVISINPFISLRVILISVVSTFYYLRLVKAMFFESKDTDGLLVRTGHTLPEVIALSGVFLVAFILLPHPLYSLILYINL